MIEQTLQQIFPQLTKLSANPLSLNQFSQLSYFSRFKSLLSEKQCKSRAQKSHKYFKMIRVKRGTVIYGCDQLAQNGYILIDGCVQLLKKKNNRQKTQAFPLHILHSLEDKQKFLFDKFKIAKNKVQNLINFFYDQKIEFKYMFFHKLYNNEQFGFGQIIRNTTRAQTAIAVQQSQILVIKKNDFDQILRDFHQKKQNILISNILSGCKQQTIQQMQPKMLQIHNSSLLLKYENQQVVYQQNQFPSDIYFIVQGQVQLRKKTLLTVPKKYMKHEIKDLIQKECLVKICKYQKGSFIGEQQIFSGRKQRAYKVVSTLNNTILFKIDSTLFLKSITDFTAYQKMLIESAVFKKFNADSSYQKQYKKILSSFINQYEAYDSKKKEQMLENLMKDDSNKNQLFQAYKPEGVFFRDTFQKLQGFQQYQNSPNKKPIIRRHKQQSSHMQNNKNSLVHSKQSPTRMQIHNEKYKQQQIAEKRLFSPKKSMNIAQIYTDKINDESIQLTPVASISVQKQKTEKTALSETKVKKSKSIAKFQQIQKDEAIFKRVLIKNGLYPIDKKIDKSNSTKALIHHNFDQVIKQCISRKNQAIKRTNKQRQDQIVVQSYNRTVQSLKHKSMTSSKFIFSTFTAPCKGTEELKKRMQSIHNLGSSRLSDANILKKKSIITKIQDCIGVNEKPKSSEIVFRQSNSFHPRSIASQHRSPQKIVLLNHMMKPIVYFNSTEL